MSSSLIATLPLNRCRTTFRQARVARICEINVAASIPRAVSVFSSAPCAMPLDFSIVAMAD